MNEVLNAEAISKRDSFCIRIQESFKNMNCSNDCEDIPSILAEFEEYIKSDQQAEIEQLKQIINGYVSDQEIWVSGYQGTQAENEQLKVEIERLTEGLEEKKKECREIADDYQEMGTFYYNETVKTAELQKQVDKLTERLSYFQKSSDYHEGNQKELEVRNADLQKQVDELKVQKEKLLCEIYGVKVQ